MKTIRNVSYSLESYSGTVKKSYNIDTTLQLDKAFLMLGTHVEVSFTNDLYLFYSIKLIISMLYTKYYRKTTCTNLHGIEYIHIYLLLHSIRLNVKLYHTNCIVIFIYT